MKNNDIGFKALVEAIATDFENLPYQNMEVDNSLQSLLEWSSLNSLLITARIKHDFGVDLLPGELRATETFKELLALINDKRST